MLPLLMLAGTALCDGPGPCPTPQEILAAAKEQHDMDNGATMAALSAEDPDVHFDIDRYPPRISHVICGAPWRDESVPKVECSFRLQFRRTRTYEVARLEQVEGRWRIDRIQRVIRQR